MRQLTLKQVIQHLQGLYTTHGNLPMVTVQQSEVYQQPFEMVPLTYQASAVVAVDTPHGKVYEDINPDESPRPTHVCIN